MALPDILARAKAAGHVTFAGPWNLNLIGVRSASREAGRFDDVIHACYESDGMWRDHVYRCTTDPGVYWLEHPGRVEGTAILAPGQYRGCWALGKHRGQYEALVQVAPMAVYRDRDLDGILEMAGTPIPGVYGINCHRANASATSTVVDRWSAGCQVLANPQDFAALLGICKLSAAKYGPRFSYTLLEDR